MRSMRLLAVAVMAVVLVLYSTGNVFAVPQVTLTPNCGPPGSSFVLHATPYLPPEQLSYSPDVFDAPGCDSNGAIGCYFTVRGDAPPGHYAITYTDGGGSASATYDVPCSTVGGVVEPVNKLAGLAPWLAVIGLAGCVGTVVVLTKPWKKPEN